MSRAPDKWAASEPRHAESWARCQGVLEQSLARHEASAWSVAVRQGGRAVGALQLGHARAFALVGDLPGPLRRLAEPEPLTAAHAFDWASLTKAVGGQLLLMQEVAAGRLDPDAPLGRLLPAFAEGAHGDIKLAHALRYVTGMPAWRPLYALVEPHQARDAVLVRQGLEAAPGARRLYSDLGHIALGLAVAQAAGASLDALFARRVSTPLGLARSGYLPSRVLRAPSVATSFGNVYERRMLREADFGLPWAHKGWSGAELPFAGFRDGPLVGEVDDGNAWYWLDGVSAHAGLFGPADELALLAEAMVLGGFDAALGLTPKLRQAFVTADGDGRLPTWWQGAELDLPVATSAAHGQAEAFMMRGFAGTCVYVEPAKSLVVAMLSNREHVNGYGLYVNLRPTFRDLVQIWRHG